jgi:GDPmannose 4,6-dehydratase
MKNKIAIITGITGQDGSYLADFLLTEQKNDYDLVVGLNRRSSTRNTSRISHLLQHPQFVLEECDLTDPGSIGEVVEKYHPDEFYNLAAQSHVGTSFKQPTYTFNVNTNGLVNVLDSVLKISRHTRVYQASTSEMFGKEYSVGEDGRKFQNEHTVFSPQSPYGASKLASHHLIRIYRDGYDLFTSSGILFNHESPRRGENFVTHKITKWIGEFLKWKGDEDVEFRNNDMILSRSHETFPKLRLGNLDASRDWGHAKDYVRAMWMILQQDEPDDYVICTGETHTIREFLSYAFLHIGVKDWSDYVVVDPEFYRPVEVEFLCGDSSWARKKLGWKPEISFGDLVRDMVNRDTNKQKQTNEKFQLT